MTDAPIEPFEVPVLGPDGKIPAKFLPAATGGSGGITVGSRADGTPFLTYTAGATGAGSVQFRADGTPFITY
jgi:hypothetical protein